MTDREKQWAEAVERYAANRNIRRSRGTPREMDDFLKPPPPDLLREVYYFLGFDYPAGTGEGAL